ncbi:MAG: hypothetical protein ACE5KK_01970 [Candidatus Brocadiales bacterium]
MLKYITTALFLVVVFTWNTGLLEAGVFLRDCQVKTVEAYRDVIQVQLSFKSEGEHRSVHFRVESPHNPYARAQLYLLRDALIFRKEVDVLVEEVKKKSLVLGVSLSQRTHE